MIRSSVLLPRALRSLRAPRARRTPRVPRVPRVLRLAAIAVAIAVPPALAGCAAGVNAQTNKPFATTDGASTVFHNIAIRDMFVLGPDAAAELRPGQSASLFLALVNNGGPDRLTSVFAPDAASVTIRGGTVNLAPGQAALLTGPEPRIILEQLRKPLVGGAAIAVTLFFQNAGAITLTVPVVPRSGYYTTFSAPPSPTPSAAPKSKGPRPRQSGGSSATPSASPTTTP